MQFLKALFSFFTKKDKSYSIFLVILMLFTAQVELIGIGALFPYIKILSNTDVIHSNSILSTLYDAFGFTHDNHFMVFLGICIFLALLLKAVLSSFNNYFQAVMTYRINNRMAKDCLSKYYNLPLSYVVKDNTSVLSKHLLVDISSVSTMIQTLLTLLTDAIMALALIALMIAADPKLVCTVVISLGIMMFVINKLLRKKIITLSKENELCNRYVYKYASEAFSSYKDAKVFQANAFFVNRFMHWQKKIAHQAKVFSVISNLPVNIINVMGFGLLLLVLLYLVIENKGLMEVLPTIGLIAVCVQRLLPSASRISTSLANIRRFSSVVFVLKERLESFEAHETKMILNDSKLNSFSNEMVLIDLSYRYPGNEKVTLDRVSFKVKKNSALGIVGKSGAGKSTLINILLGLLRPDTGKIEYDGVERAFEAIPRGPKFIGYVPQQIFLLDATIKENITLKESDDELDARALDAAIKVAQLEDFIKEQDNGLDTFIGENGVKISGGQRQRIGIARALYHEPAILILDEATNALDQNTERCFNIAIKSFMQNKTIIVVAHRPSALTLCDDIITLENGRIIDNSSVKVHMSPSIDGCQSNLAHEV